MNRLFKLFGLSLVKEKDLIDLENHLRRKIDERINLFMNPNSDQKIWDEIKSQSAGMTDETKIISGLRSDNLSIPKVAIHGTLYRKRETDNEIINAPQISVENIRLLPLDTHPDFKIYYHKEKDALFIGNNNIWE